MVSTRKKIQSNKMLINQLDDFDENLLLLAVLLVEDEKTFQSMRVLMTKILPKVLLVIT